MRGLTVGGDVVGHCNAPHVPARLQRSKVLPRCRGLRTCLHMQHTTATLPRKPQGHLRRAPRIRASNRPRVLQKRLLTYINTERAPLVPWGWFHALLHTTQHGACCSNGTAQPTANAHGRAHCPAGTAPCTCVHTLRLVQSHRVRLGSSWGCTNNVHNTIHMTTQGLSSSDNSALTRLGKTHTPRQASVTKHKPNDKTLSQAT